MMTIGTPLVSHYSTNFLGLVDYILYDARSHMRAIRILDLPTAIQMHQHVRGLPTPSHPSDHLPLLADFAWTHQQHHQASSSSSSPSSSSASSTTTTTSSSSRQVIEIE
jgi:mRNA deadenylase 3'-5' endonuclease subunit Ccr4